MLNFALEEKFILDSALTIGKYFLVVFMARAFESKKVLVVDNSAVMAKIIKNQLLRIGFKTENVLTANDGNQAFMMLDFLDFNLITSGLHMRAVSGFELLRSIRAHKEERIRNVPFLVISAERKEFYFNELEVSGISGYLEKPFKTHEIQYHMEKIFSPETAQTPDPPPLPPQPNSASMVSPLHPQLKSIFDASMLEALGQYMVAAETGDLIDAASLQGDFSSTITIADAANDVNITFIIYFPRDVACKIYEGIFGAVDLEQVCGVVQELGNIIAGNVKPRITELSREILALVCSNGTRQIPEGVKLNFTLGLPTAKMEDGHTVEFKDPSAPKYAIPFKVGDANILLLAIFHKNI